MLVGSSETRQFGTNCPYYQDGLAVGDCRALPMYRLIETFEDGSCFVGDTLGDGSWLDASEDTTCAAECFCHALKVLPTEENFALTIYKRQGQLQVTVHDEHLRNAIANILADVSHISSDVSFDGLLLLKYRSHLRDRIREMQNEIVDEPHAAARMAISSLFLDGVLDAPQIFRSYGFEVLVGQGYLQESEKTWFYELDRLANQDLKFMENLSRVTTTSGDTNNDPWRNNCYPPFPENGIDLILYMDPPGLLRTPSTLRTRRSRREMAFFKALHIALSKEIRNGNIAQVKSLLERSAEPSEGFKSLLIGKHRLDPLPDIATLLLTAVRNGCFRMTKLLLNNGFNPNGMYGGETPLTVALRHGSDALVRLLLSCGSDVDVARSLLQSAASRTRGYRFAAALQRLNHLATTQFVKRACEAKQKITRLRNMFQKELGRINEMISTKESSVRAETYVGGSDHLRCHEQEPPIHRQSSPDDWGAGLHQNAESSWTMALTTMRGLCNGRLPRKFAQAIMFLTLVKSMASTLGEGKAQKLEREFFDDLARWQIVFGNDNHERQTFITAVKDIWGIDVTASNKDGFENPEGFATTLQHFQDLTLQFVNDAGNRFNVRVADETELMKVQARWKAKQASLKLKSPCPEGHKPFVSDSLHGPPTSCSDLSRDRSRTTSEKRSASTGDGEMGDGDPKPDPRLAVLLSGSCFAIVFAFLLAFRNPKLSSFAIGILLHDTNDPAIQIGGKGMCRKIRIVNRTRRLLEIYLDDLQNWVCAPPADYDRAHQPSELTQDVKVNNVDSEAITTASPPSDTQRTPVRKSRSTYCDECQRDFKTTSNLGKHRRDVHEKMRYPCSFASCRKSFQRNTTRIKHEERWHLAV
ncbi:hypothetical protein F5Y15DRAFT_425679 [Xylariaceae sp. FL0016]|nr:hypothetical protein F5Y15DRAFT_425679 [Xylariaceae sp. FL0016]